MAFDPTNASIITNVVANTGVTIVHTSVDGVDTFTAAVDQSWLSNYITTNVGGTLTLSAADEARIAALEAAIGAPYASTDSDGSGLVEGAIPTTAVGETGTTTVLANLDTTGLTVPAIFTYSLIGFDGTVLGPETIQAGDGNNVESLAWALYANMSRNAAMNKFWDTIEVTDFHVVIKWKATHLGSTIQIVVDSADAADNLSFTVTDY